MSEVDPVRKIIALFLIHGICKSEAGALQMLARDYVQRQLGRYTERAEHFCSFYQTSVERFAQDVAALCEGSAKVPALSHLNRHVQIMQAEDGLEEWQAAEQLLARWQAVFAFDCVDERIREVDIIVNPDKLRHLQHDDTNS